METGDLQSGEVRGVSELEENVVRFPRDWFGPIEDLVPIAPAAPTPDDRPAPAADAFWTEDAGLLHDAVQAPAGSLPSPAPEPARVHARRRPRPAVLGGALTAFAGLLAVVVLITAGGSARTPTTHADVGGAGAATSHSLTAAPRASATKPPAPGRILRRRAGRHARVTHVRAIHRVHHPRVQQPAPTNSASVASHSSVAPPPQTQTQTTPDYLSEPAHTGPADGGPAATQPAGPSGHVSLLGAGTTPSG